MATLYGIGVGPGPSDLITLRARDTIARCKVIAYICDAKEQSLAKNVVQDLLQDQHLHPIKLPMQMDRSYAIQVYRKTAEELQFYLSQGQDVGLLCLGDPLLYGSFAYIQANIAAHFNCEIIPGLSAHQYLAALSSRSLALQTEQVAICSGTAGFEKIQDALMRFDTVVVYKPARWLKEIESFIRLQGLQKKIIYGEHLGSPAQNWYVWPAENPAEPVYMSVLIIQSVKT